MTSSRRVAYFYDEEIGNFYFGAKHPARPTRVAMTHELIKHYGLMNQMEVFIPHFASDKQLTMFHSDDYIEFLKRVTPFNSVSYVFLFIPHFAHFAHFTHFTHLLTPHSSPLYPTYSPTYQPRHSTKKIQS
jgi:acetoin utilization deacetylase AcuC-like enzyme